VNKWLRSPLLPREGLGRFPEQASLTQATILMSVKWAAINSGWLLLKIANVNCRSGKSAGHVSLALWNFISPVGLGSRQLKRIRAPFRKAEYFTLIIGMQCTFDINNNNNKNNYNNLNYIAPFVIRYIDTCNSLLQFLYGFRNSD